VRQRQARKEGEESKEPEVRHWEKGKEGMPRLPAQQGKQVICFSVTRHKGSGLHMHQGLHTTANAAEEHTSGGCQRGLMAWMDDMTLF
jgi:hypothetical protein